MSESTFTGTILAYREEEFLQDDLPPGMLDSALPDEFSARLVDRLKREADRSWYSNPQRSLEFAARIMQIGRLRADPNQIALGLLAQGNALKFGVRPAEAWDALQEAGRIFLSAGNEFGWARTRIGLLGVSLFLGRMDGMLDEAARARAIFREHQNDDMLVRLAIEEGLVHSYLGDHRRALQVLHDGLAIADHLQDHGRMYQAPLYINIGYTYEKLGDYHQALAYFVPAHELLLEHNAIHGSDTAATNIAYVARIRGRYRYALQMLQAVIERAGQRSLPETLMAKGDLVECYLHLNRFAEARELARSVAAAYRELGHVYELARLLLHLALAEANEQAYDAAGAALNEAEQVFAMLGATAWLGNTWLERGQIALQRGEHQAALACASYAARRFEPVGLQEKLAQTAVLRARSLLALGEWRPAAEAAEQALGVARRQDVPALRYQAHLLLGKAAEARHDRGRALRHYRAAAASMDRVQRGLTITLRSGFLEDKEEALRALIALHLHDGNARTAFETLERAKAQILLGYLANREALRWSQDDARTRSLLDQLSRLRAEHQRFYALAHRLAGSGEPADMPATLAQAEAGRREREMRAVIEQLYLQSGEALDGRAPANATLADIQRAVGADSLLLEYYVDGGDLLAFRLDGDALTLHKLPIAAQALEQLLAQLRMNLSAALGQGAHGPLAVSLLGAARRILHRLYTALLAPLLAGAPPRRRLLIVPYGPLHYLPFHLLFDGTAYLIEQHELAVLPAANMALRPAPRRASGALILTHSWEGRLPQTRPEGQMVRAWMGGVLLAEQSALRAALEAPPAQVLHIAAHGEHRLDQPELSYLQLADGQLYADDLLQHDLSYELVTLSACETGRSRAAARDELIGLGRGFLYAGAASLLVSLWQVDDASTYRLMDGVYRGLRAGMSKSAALQSAQREMLSEQPGLHPAHWGAFQLIGDSGPLSRQAP